MNTKHFLLITAAFLPLWATVYGADQKNDISDPVLQQIIQSFSGRMPRFIDKHGKSIFVADESMTRGSLLAALYEYDKSLKSSPAASAASGVSRREFDDLKNKLNLISNGDSGGSGGAAGGDIVQIINALEPNMPTLLDSTLAKSKTFNDLKKELARVEAGGGPAVSEATSLSDDSKNTLLSLQQDMKDVKHRIDSLSVITAKTSAASAEISSSAEVKRSLARAENDISELKAKIKGLENETAEAAPPSSAASGGYASALTKISLGLSMVAAFFIAR
jgi:methyl-accepting chemotaxis protein